MIDKEKFHILNFVKLEPYSGSMDGMRYMISRVPEEGKDELDKNTSVGRIEVVIWPEPFCINATPEEKKTREYFELNEDGIMDVADYLNKMLFDRADEWKAAKDAPISLR